MTGPSGTTGNGIETMKNSEAVSRAQHADAGTKTPPGTTTEKSMPTISKPTAATAQSSTTPKSISSTTISSSEKQGQGSVESVSKSNNSTQAKSFSKGDSKEGPSKDQIKTAVTDGGNDRVTVDKKPNKPLVIGNGSLSGIAKAAEAAKTSSTTKTASKISTAASTIPKQQPLTASQSLSMTNPASRQKPSATNLSSSKKNAVTSAPNSDMDESTNSSLADEALHKQRAPLTDKYSPYLSQSDTSLADARRRLQIALDQTRQLRAAFTERVYGKYRVCLQPPPQTQDIIKALKDDPAGMHRKLELELRRITDEKNTEKREAQKINSDAAAAATAAASTVPSKSSTAANDPSGSKPTTATPSTTPPTTAPNNSTSKTSTTSATSNTDTEEYLYVTSGLSLIVLPEDNPSNIDMSMYRERSPINPKTSQRVRGISAAAATSGKLMLDRARQGKVLRADREKRLPQKANHKAHYFFDRNYYSQAFKIMGPAVPVAGKQLPAAVSRNPTLGANKTKSKLAPSRSRNSQKPGESKKIIGAKRAAASKAAPKVPAGQTAAGAKAIRARVQTPMTVQTLLNLNPIHEELRTDTKYSAATLAMMERGVGTFQGPTTQYHKNTPHRFKHPFPDSLGGRRRPVTSAGGVVDSSNATNLQLALPPIPSVKERRRHKKISVLPRTEAGTTRAVLSIRKILDQFTPSSNKAVVAIESFEAQENPLLGRPKKHRKISEIGFVRGLYLDSVEETGTSPTNGNQAADSVKKENNGIDSTLTLNVLKAVGLIKSSVSNDIKTEKIAFETSLASSFFKDVPSTEATPYSYSTSKLKELEEKLSTQKRSFTTAFYSDAEKLGIDGALEVPNTTDEPKIDDTKLNAAAPLALRGGGSGAANDEKESIKSSDKKADSGGKVAKNSKNGKSPKRKVNSLPQNQTLNAAATQANLMRQNLIRGEQLKQQRLASLQAQGVAQQNAQLQAQLQTADHLRQTNALQLAHQLRLSRLQAHGQAGDLTDYLGGLHSPQAQAAYGWPQAAAAAAVANSNNLAALGLNATGVMPLTVEGRTRVLLAREQQNLAVRVAAAQRQQAAALMRGMGVVDAPFAQAGYPRIPGQILNPAAAALIARQELQNRAIANNQQNKANQDQKAATQQTKTDAKSSQNGTTVDPNALKGKPSKQNEKPSQQASGAAVQNNGNDKKVDATSSNISSGKKRKNSFTSSKTGTQQEKKRRTSSADKINEMPPTTNVPKSSVKGTKSKPAEKQATSDKPPAESKPKTFDSNQVQEKPTSTKTENQPPTSELKKSSETQKNTSKQVPAGLKFYVPEAPPGISTDFATAVLAGRCHEAIGVSVYRDLACEGLRVVNYITSVGMAVPIPKTVVMNLLKDRMNGLVFKNSNVGSMPATSRDIIAAVILLWLWRNQEGCFQRAFAKSGRIDVDPECKWFVNAAVNKAVTALSNEVIGSTSRANGLTTALLAHKSKSSSGQKGINGKAEQDSLKTTTTKIDLLAASVVSKSLNMTLVLNEDMVSMIYG